MDPQAPPPVTQIPFPNGNTATAVRAPADAPGEQILAWLDLDRTRPLILLFGGADSLDEGVKPRLFQLLGRGVARSAVETGEAEDDKAGKSAWIIDGGTRSGVMEQMGLAVADEGRKAPVVGV